MKKFHVTYTFEAESFEAAQEMAANAAANSGAQTWSVEEDQQAA